MTYEELLKELEKNKNATGVVVFKHEEIDDDELTEEQIKKYEEQEIKNKSYKIMNWTSNDKKAIWGKSIEYDDYIRIDWLIKKQPYDWEIDYCYLINE